MSDEFRWLEHDDRTSEAHPRRDVQQGLLDLLWLGDVHLQEGETSWTGPLQLAGSVSCQVQHRGKHLKAQSIQTLRRRLPEAGVTACRDTAMGLSPHVYTLQKHYQDSFLMLKLDIEFVV